jgi:hypothetical protein
MLVLPFVLREVASQEYATLNEHGNMIANRTRPSHFPWCCGLKWADHLLIMIIIGEF